MKECQLELFQEIEWSTERVLNQTKKQAKTSNMKLELLESLDDIDTYNDLKNLYKRLKLSYRGQTDFPYNSWETLQSIFRNSKIEMDA
jgi:glycosyltransferase A (GT-A) superfamily protein (DUF2064 family)